MKCPHCHKTFKNPGNVRAGAQGGAVRGVRKGFAVPGVLAKALATRKERRADKAITETTDNSVYPTALCVKLNTYREDGTCYGGCFYEYFCASCGDRLCAREHSRCTTCGTTIGVKKGASHAAAQ